MKDKIKPVLCVVTSHPIRGDSGEPTGFAMVELTHPLEVFEAAGSKAPGHLRALERLRRG